MLGTPPAFVLSQDQTLKKLYLNDVSIAQIKFLNNLLLAILLKNFVGCCFSISLELLNKSIYLSKVFSLSLRYSIYKVQSRSLSQARLGSPRTFICYHILSNLSRTFFKFFEVFSDVCCAPGFRRSSHNFFNIP